MKGPVLIYVSNGTRLEGIPARDLYEEDIRQLEMIYPEAGDIAQILVDKGPYRWASKYSPQKERVVWR